VCHASSEGSVCRLGQHQAVLAVASGTRIGAEKICVGGKTSVAKAGAFFFLACSFNGQFACILCRVARAWKSWAEAQ
jgi:hypothetical protein